MFEQVFVAEAPGSKRFWTTCVGVTGQVALVASLILAPMVWPEALPKPTALLTLLLPPVPMPPPPKAMDAPQVVRTVAKHAFVNPNGKYVQPVRPPEVIDMTPDDPPLPGGQYVAGGIPGGQAGGVQNGVLSGILLAGAAALAPPRPVEVPRPVERTAAPPEPTRLKIGGVVLEGKLVSKVEPPYPPLARQMRVQGVVELLAVVGTDGRIRELRLLSGSPLLAPAAINAVKQWVYRPTLLNGEAVEIMAPITVTFKLN